MCEVGYLHAPQKDAKATSLRIRQVLEVREEWMEGHPVSFSRSNIVELMVPGYTNFGGKVHGGLLMSMMDKLAYVCASKHAGNYCVTVSVDGVEFLAPVEVGEMVSMLGSVNYVGSTSLVVGIKVVSENIHTGTQRHTNTSYFTMVAKDTEGNTAQVPPLILESEEDVRRFCSALQRKRLRQHARTHMQDYRDNFTVDDDVMRFLDQQRCVVAIAPNQ